jgi:hypothetical protein
MKLQLTRTEKLGEIWFTVWQDNSARCFAVTHARTEEQARVEAEACFQAAMTPVIVEILKSVEI